MSHAAKDMGNQNEPSHGVGSGASFGTAPKLDADQREEANALIEQIIEDPERFAFEIVALRGALREIAEDPANAVSYYEDKWRTIARKALGLHLPNAPVSNGPESEPHRQQNDRTP